MKSVIVVHADFDRTWPFAADHFARLWQAAGSLDFIRVADADRRPLGELVQDSAQVARVVALQVPVTAACIRRLAGLQEPVFHSAWGGSEYNIHCEK